jgi:hypothetical protein
MLNALNTFEPTKFSLLNLSPSQKRLMAPITSHDIYETANSNAFHPDGLFSTEIFGRVGEAKRDITFAYIDLKTTIFHPIVYIRLGQLRALYKDILTSKAYATWNPTTNDFDPANELTGDTGYHFFISHFHELTIPRSMESVSHDRDAADLSTLRNQRITLIEKYRSNNTALMDALAVIPAGMRDIEIENGQIKEGELNPLYRQVVSIVNTISDSYSKDNPALNHVRMVLQNAVNAVVDNILSILVQDSKNGLIQSKWASRKIVNGTRNVLSAMSGITSDLSDTINNVGPNDTMMGLWQVSRGCLPLTRPAMSRYLVDEIFSTTEGQVLLVDKKTLKLTPVHVKPATFDLWTTREGLAKLVNKQRTIGLRSRPLLVDDYYLALVYKPPSVNGTGVFKVFRNMDNFPKELDKNHVHPITLMELIYLCNYRTWNKTKVFVTRYPITGEGSIYPSNVRVATTVRSDVRYELDDDWTTRKYPEEPASVYPNFEGEQYIDTMMVHPFKVGGLGADFDGDMTSANFVNSLEAIEEINAYFKTREAYVDPAGGFRASISTDLVDLVFKNATGFSD